ncbi:hypothetical protein B0T11DRAFT_326607 [Plectosphaerella cucumerina]|uniref:Uncharacterized protein n=1 Tax=Plectosphaerella cucumerina TaxID=40658 RepID=A0A8K0TJ11_9PEZI|nr:hypothetical protein B0T11DRAFT_326607 [Plectosphaerella cucumerina]
MKSSIFITGVISLLIGTTVASPADIDRRQEKAPGVGDKSADCDDEFDCCYSSEAACFRQLGYVSGNIFCPLHKYCATDYNIPRSKCNADCCSISTGWGRGCPGK